MSFLFKSPKVQAPPPPEPTPPVPTIDAAANQQDFADKLRRRRGRRSTILVPETLGKPALPMQPLVSTLGGA